MYIYIYVYVHCSEAQKVGNIFCNTIFVVTLFTCSEVLSSVGFISTSFTALQTSPLHASGSFCLRRWHRKYLMAERQKPQRAQCAKRWKRHFLMRNGLFYLAERQKPQRAQCTKRWKRHVLMRWFLFYLFLFLRTTEASRETLRFCCGIR